MKKVISVVGARPNFMKVAPIHRAFQKYSETIQHLIAHTGQHYDFNMSDSFFIDLKMPKPDYFLGIGSASHAVQTAKIMTEFEQVVLKEKPDLVIVVGDVNSTIACSLTAIKLGIKVAHVEAGLRSYDREMPEEVNRLATDAISTFCFLTEESGLMNLKSEGFDESKMFFVGNTMIDSLEHAIEASQKQDIYSKYDKGSYALITMHRPSNVDTREQLQSMLETFKEISRNIKIVFPVHPRTNNNIKKFELGYLIENNENIDLLGPLGYLEFLALMQKAKFVLTDSGGIQEETTKLLVPCLTMRTSTERPSTINIGTNTLINPRKDLILEHTNKILSGNYKTGVVPPLWDGKAAERITEIISNLI
jgi:UDP-N-acetylglucosamine 2-epimerase (non-hydrolysing)